MKIIDLILISILLIVKEEPYRDYPGKGGDKYTEQEK